MTLPKNITVCPVCGVPYVALSCHLRKSHNVDNPTERLILLKLGTGRTQIRYEPCPVPGCIYQSSRLDKHLDTGHSELTTAQRKTHLANIKKQKAISLLVELRASNPAVPLATSLDIDVQTELEEAFQGLTPEEEEVGKATEHCKQCRDLKTENASLKSEVNSLFQELATVRKTNRILSRRLRRVQGRDSFAEDEPGPDTLEPEPDASKPKWPSLSISGPRLAPEVAKGMPPVKPFRTSSQQEESRQANKPPPGPTPGPSTLKAESAKNPGPGWSSPSGLPGLGQSLSGPKDDYESLLNKKGRASLLRKIVFPKSIEEYLDEYQKYQAGAAASGRRIESAQSKVSRVRAFLFFLGRKKQNLWNWLFMADMNGVRRYVETLQKSSKAVTTANFYLRNVSQFLAYFKETKPKQCRLSQVQIVAVERCILKALRDLRKKITLHQVDVKRVKMAGVVTVASLQKCYKQAKAKIPSLLDELEDDKEGQVSKYRFYGYFAAFVASLYGHRPGVITNMLLKEVAMARETGSPEKGYIINVANHKTAHVFGAAQLYLLPEEFNWLERWVVMRPRVKPMAQNDLVFFTAGKSPMKNLNAHLQQAWNEMGLPGKPTFTDVRTAVSAHAKNVHPPEVRVKMTTYMCHDEATADKFYALSLNTAQSVEMRRRFETTLQTAQDVSEEDEPGAAAEAGASASTPCSNGKRKRRTRPSSPRSSSSSEEDDSIMQFQETGSSCLEEEQSYISSSSPDISRSPQPKTKSSPMRPRAKKRILWLDISPVKSLTTQADPSRHGPSRSSKIWRSSKATARSRHLVRRGHTAIPRMSLQAQVKAESPQAKQLPRSQEEEEDKPRRQVEQDRPGDKEEEDTFGEKEYKDAPGSQGEEKKSQEEEDKPRRQVEQDRPEDREEEDMVGDKEYKDAPGGQGEEKKSHEVGAGQTWRTGELSPIF